MAWGQIGDKPLSEPMLTRFIDTYIYSTRGDEFMQSITISIYIDVSNLHSPSLEEPSTLLFPNSRVQPHDTNIYSNATWNVSIFSAFSISVAMEMWFQFMDSLATLEFHLRFQWCAGWWQTMSKALDRDNLNSLTPERWGSNFNSLTPGTYSCSLNLVIFKLISTIDIMSISCEITVRWMPRNLTYEKSKLVQVMDWCR